MYRYIVYDRFYANNTLEEKPNILLWEAQHGTEICLHDDAAARVVIISCLALVLSQQLQQGVYLTQVSFC